MNFPDTIGSYIEQEENAYLTEEVPVLDNWDWNMSEHIQNGLHFKYGKYRNLPNDLKTKPPFDNKALPNLRLRYRAENVDLKDILLYIDDPEKNHFSFLVKKYHDDVFAVEHNIDEFIDEAKEGSIDLGGCLTLNGPDGMPQNINLLDIAFCDQTDILSGPFALKYNYSPSRFLKIARENGWGVPTNGATATPEEIIELAHDDKDVNTGRTEDDADTTGKNIEVYVVRGDLPMSYLNDSDDDEVVKQLQVVAMYKTKDNKKGHEILYRKKETRENVKFFSSEPIHGRALGLGGVEELYDPIVWGNFAEIHKKDLLKAASKIVYQTDDPDYLNRNSLDELENMQITVTQDGKSINQIQTGTPNINLFNDYIDRLKQRAQELSGATAPLLGEQPPSGSTFRGQERAVVEGKELHNYRSGKFAKYLEEIYRDWIIPQIIKEITKGKRFLTTLTADEMSWLVDKVAKNRAARAQADAILGGNIPAQFEVLVDIEKQKLLQRGNKQFFEILKDELKDASLQIKIVVGRKQRDLQFLTENTVAVLREYLAVPQLRQDPFARKLVSQILEFSGMDAVDFELIENTAAQAEQVNAPQGAPAQSLQNVRATAPEAVV